MTQELTGLIRFSMCDLQGAQCDTKVRSVTSGYVLCQDTQPSKYFIFVIINYNHNKKKSLLSGAYSAFRLGGGRFQFVGGGGKKNFRA